MTLHLTKRHVARMRDAAPVRLGRHVGRVRLEQHAAQGHGAHHLLVKGMDALQDIELAYIDHYISYYCY